LARPAALRSFLNALFFILPNMGLLLLETVTDANEAAAAAREVVQAVGRTQVRATFISEAAPNDKVGARSQTLGIGL